MGPECTSLGLPFCGIKVGTCCGESVLLPCCGYTVLLSLLVVLYCSSALAEQGARGG